MKCFFLKQYDDDVINLGRTTNRKIQLAEKLKSFFPDEITRKSVKILDVAAGTGLVGVELKKEGFGVIHKWRLQFFLLFVISVFHVTTFLLEPLTNTIYLKSDHPVSCLCNSWPLKVLIDTKLTRSDQRITNMYSFRTNFVLFWT